MKQKILPGVIGLFIVLTTACGSANEPLPDAAHGKPTAIPVLETPLTSILLEQGHIYTTQNNLSGNHLVNGATDLSKATVIDIPLEGKPIWLLSAPFKGDVVFAAVMDDGKVHAFKILGTSYEPIDISPARLPAGMPPTLIASDDNIQILPPPDDASLLTNPISVEGNLVYIASNGNLVISSSISKTRLPINALPDSRILVDENDRLLILTEPTTRYDHGIAGDEVEASAIVIIETEPEFRVIQNIPIETPDVIEGISAIWADIDNDGARDIIVTLSNNQTGARIAAYREDGSLLAESLPIGLGHRWRHQIAVAKFHPNEPALLISVRTPHIGGIVEFFQLKDGKLVIVKEINGFSTHSIGSRNLYSALAGDFNNDGIIELLAPDQGHTNLGIVSIDGVIASVPLHGELTSNLSATEIDGKLYVGAGTHGNIRIWNP